MRQRYLQKWYIGEEALKGEGRVKRSEQGKGKIKQKWDLRHEFRHDPRGRSGAQTAPQSWLYLVAKGMSFCILPSVLHWLQADLEWETYGLQALGFLQGKGNFPKEETTVSSHHFEQQGHGCTDLIKGILIEHHQHPLVSIKRTNLFWKQYREENILHFL